jgi:hypothetical protein
MLRQVTVVMDASALDGKNTCLREVQTEATEGMEGMLS